MLSAREIERYNCNICRTVHPIGPLPHTPIELEIASFKARVSKHSPENVRVCGCKEVIDLSKAEIFDDYDPLDEEADGIWIFAKCPACRLGKILARIDLKLLTADHS